MGEAKRRRLAAAAVAERAPPEMIPAFFKGVAEIVDAFVMPEVAGGFCTLKTLIAYQAIRSSGLDASIAIGSALIRVGPHPKYDTVAWCGRNNVGEIFHGVPLFHCWIRYQDLIFDPTVGTWRGVDECALERQMSGMPGFGEVGPPVRWDIDDLPSYWLRPAAELEGPWRLNGTPEPGVAWYGPFRGDAEIAKRRLQDIHKQVGHEIATGIESLKSSFAAKHGHDYRRDDTVYPLRFSIRRA
jgi:hypothetical protein